MTLVFPRPFLVCLAAAAMLAAGVGSARAAAPGSVGPGQRILPSGQRLSPAGGGIALGQFANGGALTPDGRSWWSVSTGWGANDVRIVDLTGRRVTQTLALPGASGGIAMDPKRRRAYVSVVGNSIFDGFRRGLRGRAGDNVQVYGYNSRGRARYEGLIRVPPPARTPAPQNFPPGALKPESWPDAMAIAPDGKHLVVALNLADAAAVIDLKTRRVRTVGVGDYPHGAAVLAGGRHALVANEADGTLTELDLERGRAVKTFRVAQHLSHPGAIVSDSGAKRAYVSVTNRDAVAVVDTKAKKLRATIPIPRLGRLGTSPVALALSPHASQLLVAEAGGNELAVLTLRGSGGKVLSRPVLAGRIPVAQYPTSVAVTGGRAPQIVWQAGKALGIGPNLNGPNPFSPDDPAFLGMNPAQTSRQGSDRIGYPPGLVNGELGMTPVPNSRQLRTLTARANATQRPGDTQKAPADTPLRPGGPIHHVFWIVRENRTYDQTLGDDARGDGDPKLTLFGADATPNVHALVNRFPLLDHVYANSEASIQGHFITSAATVPDYVERNWYANYAGRPRPYDFGVFSVTWPTSPWLFDAAQAAGVSYFNYGEPIAGDIDLLPDKDRTPADLVQVKQRAANSDLGVPATTGGCYDNSAFIGINSISDAENFDDSLPSGAPTGSTSRFDCFRSRLRRQLADGTVPGFNYLVLPNNHTRGTQAGSRTPRAMVAENDQALGEVVDEISHSAIWGDSAIFVAEDDSQDGADHVDAHRIDAEVISPYARTGAVISRRYDLYSAIRSMELILGIRPVSINDVRAVPMYDAFSPTPDNAAPYDAIRPAVDQLERNAAGAAGAALSARMNRRGTDAYPQRVLDRVLWRSVHGRTSTPPPPGPNATPETGDNGG